MRGARRPRTGSELREIGVIPDGALLIHDGVIEEVGASRRVENLSTARGAIEINAGGRVVMPAFIDSHTHLICPPVGVAPDDTAAAARAVRASTGQRLHWRAEANVASMARHGTVAVDVKTGCGSDESAEGKLLRVLTALHAKPLHIAPTFLLRLPSRDVLGDIAAQDAVAKVCGEILPKFLRKRFASFADLSWDPDPARYELYAQYLTAARALGLKSRIHAHGAEPRAAIAAALEYSALSIDHLEHATAADSELLAGTGIMATLLPLVTFSHGGRPAPARALIEAGVPVALGSNFNPQHSPALSMQSVVSIACRHYSMAPEEAVSAATINAAHAIGAADRMGSLELGKHANLLILNISDYREIGHLFGTNAVHMTMHHGKFIYKEAEVAPRAAEEFAPRLWD